MHFSVETFKLLKYERSVCQFFIVRDTMFYKKIELLKKERIV